ncbi:MAG TPA: hypothetical protein ENF73_02480, partial [Proteobacteria bacterium]|nr:hypothetical protein [Pseudomonadota bacterium]
MIDNITCEPLEGAYIWFNGEEAYTDADGKATFALTKNGGNTLHVLTDGYNFKSYVDVNANTFLVRLNPHSSESDLTRLPGTFTVPEGNISDVLPQADSVLQLVTGGRLVAGLALQGITRDVLATLNFEAIFSGTTIIEIPPIPGILPDGAEFEVPENLWIPYLAFGIGPGGIELDPYYLTFGPEKEVQPIAGTALSADVASILEIILPYIDEDPFPYWLIDWGQVLSYINIERTGLERNFKPGESARADISLSVPITTGFGTGVPAYPFTVNVSGLPSKDLDVINIAAGECPWRGLGLFWIAFGTSDVLMGAAPKDGVYSDMKYLVFSAATDILTAPDAPGYL